MTANWECQTAYMDRQPTWPLKLRMAYSACDVAFVQGKHIQYICHAIVTAHAWHSLMYGIDLVPCWPQRMPALTPTAMISSEV